MLGGIHRPVAARAWTWATRFGGTASALNWGGPASQLTAGNPPPQVVDARKEDELRDLCGRGHRGSGQLRRAATNKNVLKKPTPLPQTNPHPIMQTAAAGLPAVARPVGLGHQYQYGWPVPPRAVVDDMEQCTPLLCSAPPAALLASAPKTSHVGVQAVKLGLQRCWGCEGCAVAQVEHLSVGNGIWAGRER
jgi:hypothetical protein